MANFTAALANLPFSTMNFLSSRNVSSDYESFLVPPPSGLKPPLPPIFGMTDSQAASVMPIVLHWLACLLYEAVDYLNMCPKARVWQFTDEKRNLVSRKVVLQNVLTMHAIQMIFVLAANHYLPEPPNERVWGVFGSPEYFGLALRRLLQGDIDPKLLYILSHGLEWVYLGYRQFLCFLVFDTWAYWVHWALHVYPSLYRRSSTYLMSHHVVDGH
jgi:sterol desaturase/sphingolipid hydroxylase (fatty acid hydroxylase superfamily)